MDWENKFYTIVKETKDNLAKAKEKLSSKTTTTISDYSLGTARPDSRFQQNIAQLPLSNTVDLDMSGDQNVQILHLQEQINYQNRTVEKLQKLVVSLNNERNFYREQISQLKDDMDRLTDKMNSQNVAVSLERQVSSVKRELMHEIEKVKVMVHSYAEEATNTKRSSLSSSWNEDFWTMKENLTESLERVHREISTMIKRLDKLESQNMVETCDRSNPTSLSKNAHGTSPYQSLPIVYTPVHKVTEGASSMDVQNLRQTVNSLNSKLNNLEKKIDTVHFQQPPVFSQPWSGHARSAYIPTKQKSSDLTVDDDDLQSFSDLSDISNLSGNNTDVHSDELSFELSDGSTSKQRTKSKRKVYKSGNAKIGKLLSLSDSDLEDVDLETDSLDLL